MGAQRDNYKDPFLHSQLTQGKSMASGARVGVVGLTEAAEVTTPTKGGILCNHACYVLPISTSLLSEMHGPWTTVRAKQMSSHTPSLRLHHESIPAIVGCPGQDLKFPRCYFEGHGEFVNMLPTPASHVVPPVIPVVNNLLTTSILALQMTLHTQAKNIKTKPLTPEIQP